MQHIDRCLVGEVGVVDDERDRSATGGGQEQAAERADHLVAGERALERLGRRGQRGQLGQHRARPSDRRRRAAPGRRATSCSTTLARGAYGPPASVAPTAITVQPSARATRCHLPAERRLADPCRASHDKRADFAAPRRPQQGGDPRQLELAADEGRARCCPTPRRTRRRWPRSRRSAASPARGASAVRSRPYQRIAAGRLPAASSRRISSRYAGSSVGSTSTNRSHWPLRRSSST